MQDAAYRGGAAVQVHRSVEQLLAGQLHTVGHPRARGVGWRGSPASSTHGSQSAKEQSGRGKVATRQGRHHTDLVRCCMVRGLHPLVDVAGGLSVGRLLRLRFTSFVRSWYSHSKVDAVPAPDRPPARRCGARGPAPRGIGLLSPRPRTAATLRTRPAGPGCARGAILDDGELSAGRGDLAALLPRSRLVSWTNFPASSSPGVGVQ